MSRTDESRGINRLLSRLNSCLSTSLIKSGTEREKIKPANNSRFPQLVSIGLEYGHARFRQREGGRERGGEGERERERENMKEEETGSMMQYVSPLPEGAVLQHINSDQWTSPRLPCLCKLDFGPQFVNQGPAAMNISLPLINSSN